MSDLFAPPLNTPTRLNPWHELAVSALLVMQLSWISLLYSGVVLGSLDLTFARSFFFFAFILFSGYYLPRGMQAVGVKIRIRQGLFSLLLAVSLWLGVQLLVYGNGFLPLGAFVERLFTSFITADFLPYEFWTLLVILLVWQRGVSLARSPIDSASILGSFKIGMLMFIAYGLIRPLPQGPFTYWVLFMFAFSGLVALSVSRLYEISHLRGGKRVRFHRTWLIGIGLVILLVLASGFLISNLLQSQLMEFTRLAVQVIIGLVVGLVFLMIIPILGLFILLLPWLEQLFGNLNRLQILELLSEAVSDALRTIIENPAVETTLDVINAGKNLTLVLILLAVVAGILVGLRLLRWRERQTGEEQGEILVTPEDVLGLLRKRARELAGSLANRLDFRRARRALIAVRVRWIYAQLIELAARLDKPRPAAATPLEFLPVLNELFPTLDTELAGITHSYLMVRYGELPEREEDLVALQEAWERVKGQGRQQLVIKRRGRKS